MARVGELGDMEHAPRGHHTMLVLGGFFIFPATDLLIRVAGGRSPLSVQNSLRYLGMQVDSRFMTFSMTFRFGLEEAKKYAEGNPID
jgi:hypothetical protein